MELLENIGLGEENNGLGQDMVVLGASSFLFGFVIPRENRGSGGATGLGSCTVGAYNNAFFWESSLEILDTILGGSGAELPESFDRGCASDDGAGRRDRGGSE